MASNDDFELTENYKNNVWAAHIHKKRKDEEELKREKAASHSSPIHPDISSAHDTDFENIDLKNSEYCSAKLTVDDMQLFGRNPRTDDLILVMCWDCENTTKVQNFLCHIEGHHQSIEEYERKINLSKKYAAYVASAKLYEATVNSKKRKKEAQASDGFVEEKSKDLESQSNSFLSQNSPASHLPIECEKSVSRGSSYSVKKRKKGLSQSNRSKSNKAKTKVGYQSQENVQILSNSVYSEQSTSFVHLTGGGSFSYQTSPDSNHSVISGHSTALPGSTIYSSNLLNSLKQSPALDFQSNDRGKDNSQLNYSNQSPASVLSQPIECPEQQPCTNSFESKEVVRTPSNQNFMQISTETLFPSEQDIDYTDHFLSIENKQPVKSPPRPCLETSISNSTF